MGERRRKGNITIACSADSSGDGVGVGRFALQYTQIISAVMISLLAAAAAATAVTSLARHGPIHTMTWLKNFLVVFENNWLVNNMPWWLHTTSCMQLFTYA